jgi:two-component system, sensor histidine kinase and response regulator
LRRLVGIFLETTPPLVEKLREAVAAGDATALFHAAHTLRGSLSHLDESDSKAAAIELEQMGRTGSLNEAAVTFAELERHLTSFTTTLRRWLEQSRN